MHYVEFLSLTVMVFGDGDEGGGPHGGISALIMRGIDFSLSLSPPTHIEERSGEVTVRRQLSDPRTDPSQDTDSASTLILELRSPET